MSFSHLSIYLFFTTTMSLVKFTADGFSIVAPSMCHPTNLLSDVKKLLNVENKVELKIDFYLQI